MHVLACQVAPARYGRSFLWQAFFSTVCFCKCYLTMQDYQVFFLAECVFFLSNCLKQLLAVVLLRVSYSFSLFSISVGLLLACPKYQFACMFLSWVCLQPLLQLYLCQITVVPATMAIHFIQKTQCHLPKHRRCTYLRCNEINTLGVNKSANIPSDGLLLHLPLTFHKCSVNDGYCWGQLGIQFHSYPAHLIKVQFLKQAPCH